MKNYSMKLILIETGLSAIKIILFSLENILVVNLKLLKIKIIKNQPHYQYQFQTLFPHPNQFSQSSLMGTVKQHNKDSPNLFILNSK